MDVVAVKLKICMLLQSSNQSIPIRTALAEVYGEHFTKKGHSVLAIISSSGAKKYCWKGIQVYEVPLLRKLKLAKKFIEEENCNLLQVRNDCVNGILGLFLKWKYKVPLVFQYTWPVLQVMKEKNGARSEKTLYMENIKRIFADFVQMRILRRSDLILPISKSMEEYLISRGLSETRMLCFPCGVNPDLFSSSARARMERRIECRLDSSGVIVYVGVIDNLRRLDFLIRVFKKVKRKVENAKLLMVGDGNDKNRLRKLVSTLGIDEDVVFTGEVPYCEVPSFLAASDVAVVPLPPTSVYLFSSPLKLFEYMGAGKAVIANKEIPEQREVVQESGGGLLAPYDEEDFEKAIVKLLTDSNTRKKMGRKGREWVLANRSYKMLAKKVEGAYFDLVNKNAHK